MHPIPKYIYSAEEINKHYAEGHDVNKVYDAEGWTDLHYACRYSNLEAVKAIVNLGANVNAMCRLSSFAIDRAVINGRLDIIKYLIHEKNADWSNVICCAVSNNNTEIFDYILQLGPDLEIRYYLGTILMVACTYCNIDMVSKLLKAGSDVNIIISGLDYGSISPLIYSKLENSLNIIKLLVSYGLNIDQKYDYGNTALICACVNKKIEIVEFLVSMNCDVNCVEKKGQNRTALMIACENNSIEIVKILLKAGADCSIKSKSGKFAIDFTSNEEIKFLIIKRDHAFGLIQSTRKMLIPNKWKELLRR
jgi:ankyrin repeat protein